MNGMGKGFWWNWNMSFSISQEIVPKLIVYVTPTTRYMCHQITPQLLFSNSQLLLESYPFLFIRLSQSYSFRSGTKIVWHLFYLTNKLTVQKNWTTQSRRIIRWSLESCFERKCFIKHDRENDLKTNHCTTDWWFILPRRHCFSHLGLWQPLSRFLGCVFGGSRRGVMSHID